jgi:hypothetical protein
LDCVLLSAVFHPRILGSADRRLHPSTGSDHSVGYSPSCVRLGYAHYNVGYCPLCGVWPLASSPAIAPSRLISREMSVGRGGDWTLATVELACVPRRCGGSVEARVREARFKRVAYAIVAELPLDASLRVRAGRDDASGMPARRCCAAIVEAGVRIAGAIHRHIVAVVCLPEHACDFSDKQQQLSLSGEEHKSSLGPAHAVLPQDTSSRAHPPRLRVPAHSGVFKSWGESSPCGATTSSQS